MTNIISQVVSLKSILSIQAHLNGDHLRPEDVYCDLETLKANVSKRTDPIELVQPMIEKPTSLTLVAGDETTDKENAKIVFKSLQNLSPYLASDIRLWFTLGIELFDDYTTKRWPLPTGLKSNPKKHVLDRLISDTGRSLRRNNAIGRLWRIGWVANQCQRLSFEEAIDALLVSQDVAASFLDRVSLVQVRNLSDALLHKMHNEYVTGGRYKRDEHRDFLKRIDLYAGSHSLATMTSKEMDQLINELFDKAYPAAS